MLCLALLLAFDDLRYLRAEVVEVTGTEHHEHVKVALLHEVEHVVLADEALLYAWLEVVVDELAGDAGDGFLACGVDVAENDLVELTERVGEIVVEVACADRKSVV